MDETTVSQLQILVQRALAAYPAEAVRIQRGAALVASTTLQPDGSATVLSNAHRWHVTTHCPCPDAALGNAPHGHCKHRWAKCLAHKLSLEAPMAPWLPRRYFAEHTDGRIGIAGAQADGTLWFQATPDTWEPARLGELTLLGLCDAAHTEK